MPYPLKLIIYTDLNDTLLDRNYRFDDASEALELIRRYDIPLIISTSKTRGQTEIYRKRMALNYPLIVENGGAIHFPPGSFPTGRLPEGCRREGGEFVWEFTRPAQDLLPDLKDAAKVTNTIVETISEMPVERIMEYTGMSKEESELAKDRRYTIYFTCKGDRDFLFAELKYRGLKPTWGSYFCHLGYYNDKGLAVHKLTSLYRTMGFLDFTTAALGDNMNDYTMFQTVDRPIIVERPGGGHFSGIDIENIYRVEGIGPIGWNRAVIDLVNFIDWNY
ncbi:hypothetical protein ISS30_03650 [bacterium]|nr:hypothetical protein [bacterium]